MPSSAKVPTATVAAATGGKGERMTSNCRQRRLVASHLGKDASACILAEEEPRRIRDVVNLSRLLGLPLREDDDNGTDDDREDDDG